MRQFQVGQVKVNLVQGDIAQVHADALITAINSSGIWFGGIDGVIQRAAGNAFHSQAMASMPLSHSQVIIAKSRAPHGGLFQDVIFVVDDLKSPLRAVIEPALVQADKAKYKHVSLPAIRTGVMLGAVEKDAAEAVVEIIRGVQAFGKSKPSHLKELTFVIYGQTHVYEALWNSRGLPS